MNFQWKMGPVLISCNAKEPPRDHNYRHFKKFEVSEKEKAPVALKINILQDLPPPAREEIKPLASHDKQWYLYPWKKGFCLEILEQIEFKIRDVAYIRPDWKEVDFYLLPSLFQESPKKFREGWYISQVLTPFFQWWITAFLATPARGFVLHGSAVAVRGKGFVFFGPSGAGKSTLAELCMKHEGATVLNDDRIIIWHDGKSFQVSGTPWHGDLREISPITVPLSHFCLLKQGPQNSFQEMKPGKLIPRILEQAFLPLWSQKKMEGLLQVCTQMMAEIPSGQLEFTKNKNAVDYVVGLSDPESVKERSVA